MCIKNKSNSLVNTFTNVFNISFFELFDTRKLLLRNLESLNDLLKGDLYELTKNNFYQKTPLDIIKTTN
jgi:hypothetical protein